MNPEEIIARQKEKLLVEVMEDYVITAELGHLAKDQKKHKEKMRGHFQKLLAWHSTSIKEILEGVKQEIAELPEKKDVVYCSSYGICKSDTINHLESIIKKL